MILFTRKQQSALLLGAVCCLALLLAGCAGRKPAAPAPTTPPTPALKPYTSNAGRFTVLLPGRPIIQVRTFKVPGGKMDVHLFTAEEGNHASYVVSYYDFAVSTANVDPREVAASATQGAVKSVGGAVRHVADIAIQGYIGREVEAEVSKGPGLLMRGRAVLVQQRVYMLYILWPKSEASGPNRATRFLNSFRVTSS